MNILRLSFLVLCIFGMFYTAFGRKKFVIVTASYNNSLYYKMNLDSVLSQKNADWQLVYFDDCSSDGTGALVEDYLKQKGQDFVAIDLTYEPYSHFKNIRFYVEHYARIVKQLKDSHRIVLIKNRQRKYSLHNIVLANYASDNREIMVEVDGDDALAHDGVLERLEKEYSSRNIWLTHGNFIRMADKEARPWDRPVPFGVIKRRAFRKNPGVPSHLHSFYAGLFKRIKLADLLRDGDFYRAAIDIAFSMPMLEMASPRFAFISDVLLIYNNLNQINICKVSQSPQRTNNLLIRHQPKYKMLKRLF